jgi:hypothetical protein
LKSRISDAAGPEKADLDRQGYQLVAAGNAAALAAAVLASYPLMEAQVDGRGERAPRVLIDESDGVSISENVFAYSDRSDVAYAGHLEASWRTTTSSAKVRVTTDVGGARTLAGFCPPLTSRFLSVARRSFYSRPASEFG